MHVCCACTCTYVHVHTCMCIHAWGSPSIPPTPTKNLKAQILLEAEIWHIMSLDAKLQIFSSKFEVVVGGGVWHQTPTTTTPKLQLDFKSKKSSCSLGVVVVGGVWHQTPPPPPLNFNLTLSPKSQVGVYGWWWGGLAPDTPPPPLPQTLRRKFSKSKKLS